MTATKIMLDSSTWIQYFVEKTSPITVVIDEAEGILQTSVLSLYEIKNRLRQLSFSMEDITKVIEFVRQTSQIIPVEPETALQAADYHEQYRLPAIDSLIYSSARAENAEILTLDADFQKVPHAILLAR